MYEGKEIKIFLCSLLREKRRILSKLFDNILAEKSICRTGDIDAIRRKGSTLAGYFINASLIDHALRWSHPVCVILYRHVKLGCAYTTASVYNVRLLYGDLFAPKRTNSLNCFSFFTARARINFILCIVAISPSNRGLEKYYKLSRKKSWRKNYLRSTPYRRRA